MKFVQNARRLLAIMLVLWTLGAVSSAHADEPWILTGEVDFALPLTAPQTTWFHPGASAALGVYRSLSHWIVLGVRARTGALLDKRPDTVVRDSGTGTWTMGSFALRLRPFSDSADPRRAEGFWIEGAGGGGFTGDLLRPSFEAGIGWSFALGDVRFGPALRYMQIIDSEDSLDSRDARLLLAGLEFALFDASESARTRRLTDAPKDSDNDGIIDSKDACPLRPEDKDNFKDDDGCPDPDNDQDKILDRTDACPNLAEDVDGFEDTDGCPDSDNDEDGFLDIDDECPNEAEVVNGIDDKDGCPDKGLIELVEDRVILEERVLFDTNRARVRSAARPVVQAIVDLWKQHPEWTELRIEGHADARGNAKFNQRLSERRAAQVRKALIKRGIPADIIEAEGYGASRLRDTGTTPEAHRRNRRVEFVIVKGIQKKVVHPGQDAEAGNETPSDAFDTELLEETE